LFENQEVVINGWKIFAHPLFLKQFEELLMQVEQLCQKSSSDYKKKNATKRLAAIAKLAFEVVPEDPSRNEHRQGSTLGDEYKYWFRAKFFQQYRLFFRYHQERKIILLAWVNDETSKWAYESGTDAYKVFRKMLKSGQSPDDWDDLLTECEGTISRLKKAVNTEI
jgi:toxin YhaV